MCPVRILATKSFQKCFPVIIIFSLVTGHLLFPFTLLRGLDTISTETTLSKLFLFLSEKILTLKGKNWLQRGTTQKNERIQSTALEYHSEKGSTLKGNNWLPMSQLFPFRVDPFWSHFFPFRVDPFSEGN